MFGRNDTGLGALRKSKWWKPKDEKQRKEFELMKGDVRSLLISSKEGITARGFYKQLTDLTEGEVEYRSLGFNTFGEFLFHCDEVLEVRTDGYGGYYLFLRGGQAGEDHEHLRKLVTGQQNSKSGYKGFKAKMSNTSWTRSDILLEVLRGPQTSNLANPPKAAPNRYGSMGRKSFPKRTNGYQNNRSNGGSRFNSSTLPSKMPSRNQSSNYNDDRVVRPGLLNAVMSMMPDDDSDGEDMDDFDWSVPDVKPSQNQATNVTSVSKPKTDYDDWGLGTTIEIGKKQDEGCFTLVSTGTKASTSVTTVSQPKTDYDDWALGTTIEIGKKQDEGCFTLVSTGIKAPSSIMQRNKPIPASPPTKSDSDDDWTISNGKKVEYTPTSNALPKQNGESTGHQVSPGTDFKITVNKVNGAVHRQVRNPFVLQQQAHTDLRKYAIAKNKLVSEQSRQVSMDVVDRIEEPMEKRVHVLNFNQMILPSTIGFSARLLGVDAYGFFYMQFGESMINDAFSGLKREMQEYFQSSKVRDHYRLSSNDVSPGLMVIINVDNQFLRAKIFEKYDQNQYCTVYDLEEHDFHNVPYKDIYGITERFAKRLPQAVMCILGGLEAFLLTPKISRGFEVTPVSPPEVKVTVMKEKDDIFNLPVVMMSHGPLEEDLALLIRKNGSQFLSDPSYPELQAIRQRQNDLKKVLQQKLYIPVN